MATRVNEAFRVFMANEVNLDPSETNRARSSRDWLVSQIHSIAQYSDDFPNLYSEKDIFFGSFARRTKIRKLDDVDLMIGIGGDGTTYRDLGNQLELTVPENIALRGLCHDGTNRLNSRKVINRFVAELAQVPQYQKAELGRNGSAAILNLTSYPWSFDVVPAFFTSPTYDGRDYYVIPDGRGHWMKTDPRIDQRRVTEINQQNGGNALGLVRLAKFWNARATAPSMQSYLLECIVLSYCQLADAVLSGHLSSDFPPLLRYISTSIRGGVLDPKNIQGDINTLDYFVRESISTRAAADADKAAVAVMFEASGNHQEAIRQWGEILGPSFPSYDFGKLLRSLVGSDIRK